jgi:DNA-directed RNA polymerase specialized sigma subunit
MIDAADEWTEYEESGRREHFRNKLVLKYQPFAESVAVKIAKKLPDSYSYEQALSDAYVALLGSITRFEYGHGACFETFVGQRIFGEVMDSLRKQDILSRAARNSGQTISTLEDDIVVEEHHAFSDLFQDEVWELIEARMPLDDKLLLHHAIKKQVREMDLRRLFQVDGATLAVWLDRVTNDARRILIDAA